MRGIGIVLMAGLAVAQAPSTVVQLMKERVIPSSNALFEVGGKEPKTDKDWEAVRSQAKILIEAGDLLMKPGVAKDAANWAKFSTEMKVAATAALKAAEAKNLDKLVDEVGDQILQSCSGCHDQYMKK